MSERKCIVCGKELLGKEILYCSEECRFFNKVKKDPTTGCWKWLGGFNSRGCPTFHKKRNKCVSASRYAYCAIFKRDLKEDQHLINTCGNPYCVNPDHYRASYSGQTKKRRLSETDILSIRSDGRTSKEIAKDYGISFCSIYKIKKGATWRCLPETPIVPCKKSPPNRKGTGKFSNEDVRKQVRLLRKEGYTLSGIGDIIGCDFTTVSKLLSGKR